MAFEKEHTPGPWTVGKMQRSSNFAKDTYCVHGDGTILCRVKGGVTEDATIAAANASLIAAAPQLLRVALQYDARMLAEFPHGPDGHPATLNDADAELWREARAAIKAA